METILISLSPYIIGSALVPVQIILAILLLQSPRQGLAKGIAYVTGMTMIRLLQGLVFGQVFASSGAAEVDGSSGQSLVVTTLITVLGILLLIAAYKKWSREEDPDDPPPKWLAAAGNLTPLKALALGFFLPLIMPKLWVFTLSALAVIVNAELEQPTNALVYLLFILLAQSLLLLPIFIRLLMPKRSQLVLDGVSSWLTRNNRVIVIVVSLVFGLFFLYSGLKGFLA